MNKRIFITSDLHGSHALIAVYTNRSEFFSKDDLNSFGKFKNHTLADECGRKMTAHLIEAWNSVVKDGDDVYHLGDFAFGYNGVKKLIQNLKGNLHFISGNHDKDLRKYLDDFPDCAIRLAPQSEIVINGQMIVLSHYAMRTWNKSHHGSWHLYGHSHSTLPDDPNSLSMDVGVDNAKKLLGEYRPFSFEEISYLMRKKKFVPIDHHKEKE
jgi:calcineurin-like phosphoesterase family protein